MPSIPEKPRFPFLDLALCTAGAGLLFWLVLPRDWHPGTLVSLLRLLLSGIYLFIVPGYLLQLAFFPRNDVAGLVRLGLSFALSVSLVAPVAMLLDWLPWGLKPWPIFVAWLGLLAVLLMVAALHRWQVDSADRFTLSMDMDLLKGWKSESKNGRILLGVAALALVTALVAGTALAFTPDPEGRFTEFYILSSDGTAGNYPVSAIVGQPIMIFAGIHNHEGESMDYSMRLRLEEKTLYQSGTFQVNDKAVLELPLSFSISNPGSGQEITLELFRSDFIEPYRTVRLYMDVAPAN